MSIEIIFSFDTTGSMSSVIKSVRDNLSSTIDRLLSDIQEIKIGLISHGDYCDSPDFFWFLPPTRDANKLKQFIIDSPDTNGGDAEECYEYVLHMASRYEWEATVRILVLIGDESPHEPGYNLETIDNEKFKYSRPSDIKDGNGLLHIDWRTKIKKLRDNKVIIFSCHAQTNYPIYRAGFMTPLKKTKRVHSPSLPCKGEEENKSEEFYKEISSQTGGFYFRLNELQSFPLYMKSICMKALDGVEGIQLLKTQHEQLVQQIKEIKEENDTERKQKVEQVNELENVIKSIHKDKNTNVFSPHVQNSANKIRKQKNIELHAFQMSQEIQRESSSIEARQFAEELSNW